MENIKLVCKIYELKGMIESLSELADYDDSYNNPVIEKVESKIKEIVQEIETKGA